MTRSTPPARWRLVRAVMLVLDVVSLLAALVLATAGRYQGSLDRMDPLGLTVGSAVVVLVYPAVAGLRRLHQGRHGIGSAEEITDLAVAVGLTALALLAVVVAWGSPRLLPLSVPPATGVLGLVLLLGYRLVIRQQREGAARPRSGTRTLVFGAGAGGRQLIRSMLADPAGAYLPVGLLDDDPSQRHMRINGVRMLGDRDQLAAAALAVDARVLVIAVPSAGADLVRAISREAGDAGLAVKVLPPVADLLRSRAGIRDVRDVVVADLLGRRQIETDLAGIADYLVGRTVLVTGAGGSIGSELCRQIAAFSPGELIMLDRDESELHALQLSLYGEARLDLPQAVLADIRDGEVLERLFVDRRPDVVFHAAALKHVTMLEQYPAEGWKTNVLGTRNVLAAAAAAGVSHFVNISTDKAADPVNVLGHTKRLAEQLTAAYAARTSGRYLSVRFGNVLGSRGSVLETFAAQIARGGPVTVTDPAVTRYFMTIPEAVQLVVQAGAVGRDGEALVLDMGRPVRIADVAAQLIEMEGRQIEIRFTGLRPGEKLHEDLFGSGERDVRPVHPLISHVPVVPMPERVLADLDATGRDWLGSRAASGATPPSGAVR